jgi:lipopolysaccharide biosynthesis glycosyltransferase
VLGGFNQGTILFILISALCIIRPLMMSFQLHSLPVSPLGSHRQTLEDESTRSRSYNFTVSSDAKTHTLPPSKYPNDRVNGTLPIPKERVFFITSMGNEEIAFRAVERFVWSARNIGEFSGWIVLLTDAPNADYDSILGWTDRFAVLHPGQEHNNRTNTTTMAAFQQLNTHAFDYLSKDERFNDIELVYYLDVNTIFGNLVQPMFQDFESRYDIGVESEGPGQLWLLESDAESREMNDAQMILHRSMSQPCLEQSQSEMQLEAPDGTTLAFVGAANDAHPAKPNSTITLQNCNITFIPRDERYVMRLSKKELKEMANFTRANEPASVFRRAVLNQYKNKGDSDESVDEKELYVYLRRLLHLVGRQADTFGITGAKFNNSSMDKTERALFAISMGEKATETKIVERFVWSARHAGQYSGWIVVLSDANQGRYDSIHNWTDNVIIMAPEKEDIKNHYETSNMKYKRFKTLVLDYVSKDSRLDNVEIVYYLDVDIVFGNAVAPLFEGLEETYNIGGDDDNTKANGKMWMFHGNDEKWPIQGGQMILHRHKSQACQAKWRDLFDRESTTELAKDQWLLMEMFQEQQEAAKQGMYSELACEIEIMSQKGYIDFPRMNELKRKNNLLRKGKRHYGDFKYSPLVHLRNDGSTMSLSNKETKYFMRDLLRFTHGQNDTLGISKKALMEVTPRNGKTTSQPMGVAAAPLLGSNHSSFKDDGIPRVIFAISMGEKAAKSTLVERFVWSARNVGLYQGPIVIMTDADKNRYEFIHNWTDNVTFLEPEPQDIKTHYNTTNMKYKRFKTLILDYLRKNRNFDGVDLVYYLDVDIVFANPIWPFFQQLEEKYSIGSKKYTAAEGKMWLFHGNDQWSLQSGQIILHRELSQTCQDRWKDLFDQENATFAQKDQFLLEEMMQEQKVASERNDFSNLRCKIGVMDQEGFIDFPKLHETREKNAKLASGEKKQGDFVHAPLVHLRNDGEINTLSTEDIKFFLQDLLKFSSGEVDELGILKRAEMEITPRKQKRVDHERNITVTAN